MKTLFVILIFGLCANAYANCGNGGSNGNGCSGGGDDPVVIVGPQGPIGPQGPQGEQGIPGINGTNGINGQDGSTGPSGQDGTNGVDGSNGADGTNGVDGANGANGSNGTNGNDGASGKDGKAGDKGDPGVKGQDGKPGDDMEHRLTTNIGAEVRWYDSKRFSIKSGYRYDTNHHGHTVDAAILEIKIGKSYEERLIEKQRKEVADLKAEIAKLSAPASIWFVSSNGEVQKKMPKDPEYIKALTETKGQ